MGGYARAPPRRPLGQGDREDPFGLATSVYRFGGPKLPKSVPCVTGRLGWLGQPYFAPSRRCLCRKTPNSRPSIRHKKKKKKKTLRLYPPLKKKKKKKKKKS